MLCRENENSYARDSSLIKILKIKNAQVHEIIVQTEKKEEKLLNQNIGVREKNLISFDEWSCSNVAYSVPYNFFPRRV